jgi:chorismate mutase/prephenate dehydrogenase
MLVTVIGAEGKMGSWLLDHLPRIGFDVVTFDDRKRDNPNVLKEADIVIVSVPVSVTVDVIRKTVMHMKKGATLVEIASLKSGIHEEMVKVSGCSINAVSIHPMFGPSVKDLGEKTVAVVPVVDAVKETSIASKLFPGATIFEVKPTQHDKLMAHILSVPYLVNMALAATMGDMDLNLLKQLSGTSFALQYTLVQSIAGETTSLVHALLSENTFLEETAEELISNMKELMVATSSKKEFRELHEGIKSKMMEDPTHMKAPELRQAAYNAVKPLLR